MNIDRSPYRRLNRVRLGDRVNKWTAISDPFPCPHTNRSLVVVRCDCGFERIMQPAQFWGGYSRSCRTCSTAARVARPGKYPFVVSDAARRLGVDAQAVYQMIYKHGVGEVVKRLQA